MNYIRKLQQDLAEREQQLTTINLEISDFLCYLHGPKFAGTEQGDRKDWIATGDVISWLREVRQESVL